LDAAQIALAAWKLNQIDNHATIVAFLRAQITHRTIFCYTTGLESIRQADDNDEWADALEANAEEFAARVARLADMDTVIGDIVDAARAARNTGGDAAAKLASVLNAARQEATDVVDVDNRHVSFGLAGLQVATFFHYRVRVCLVRNPGNVPGCTTHVAQNEFNTGLYSLYFMVVQPKCQAVHLQAQ